MFRPLVLIVACLFLALPVVSAVAQASQSPAAKETPEQRADRCGIQAGIVEAAVDNRNAKRSQKRATQRILKSKPIKGTKYEANVDVLVAWIYTIPERQLNADTVTAFEKACLEFNG